MKYEERAAFEQADSFEIGDVLILFRVQGGQEYLIFDKKGGL